MSLLVVSDSANNYRMLLDYVRVQRQGTLLAFNKVYRANKECGIFDWSTHNWAVDGYGNLAGPTGFIPAHGITKFSWTVRCSGCVDDKAWLFRNDDRSYRVMAPPANPWRFPLRAEMRTLQAPTPDAFLPTRYGVASMDGGTALVIEDGYPTMSPMQQRLASIPLLGHWIRARRHALPAPGRLHLPRSTACGAADQHSATVADIGLRRLSSRGTRRGLES